MNKINFSKTNWFVLLLFGLIGQIAWSVENMYFNTFVFETIAPSLETITLMVQLSGVVATFATLVAGTVSDKLGNRRSFISFGYIIWGVSVALFGMLSPELIADFLKLDITKAVSITLAAVVVGDCVMTLFGSTANDASFNAWVTDNTESSYRGRIEGVLAILPLISMLIVAGGFGILVTFVGYRSLFLMLGAVISVCGVIGCFTIKDSPKLVKNGSLKDVFYGFKPRIIKQNKQLYFILLVVGIYGISCQIFMPYLIIYMKSYLGFSVVEYSVVFAVAILLGAVVNLFLSRVSDTMNKTRLLFVAILIMSVGLLLMYACSFYFKSLILLTFGIAGFVMIVGYIFISTLCGSIIRDNTPKDDVGKFQGVRMVFSVLIPMIIGPFIGNMINKARNIPLLDTESADIITTQYIPAPEIFLAAAVVVLLAFVIIPALKTETKNA